MDSCEVTSHESSEHHTAKTPIPQEPAKRAERKAGGTEKLGSHPLVAPLTSGRKSVDQAGRSEPTRATRFSRGAGAGR